MLLFLYRFWKHSVFVADKILSSINELKEKGNTAKGNKSFEEALNQYNRALKLSENGLNLGRERAILHTNKCAVLTEMNSLQDALESAERAIENDSTWSKVKMIRNKKIIHLILSLFLMIGLSGVVMRKN